MSRYWKSRADGVALVSAFADVAGEAVVIVANGVGKRQNNKRIEHLNAGIGEPRKVDGSIEKGKSVAEWD